MNLAIHWGKLKQSHLVPYRTKTFSDTSEEKLEENEMKVVFGKHKNMVPKEL